MVRIVGALSIAMVPATSFQQESPSMVEQTRLYLQDLQSEDQISYPLYLALIHHSDTPEAELMREVLTFHRDVGNGGLAQAMANRRGDVLQVVRGISTIIGADVAGVVSEASALYRSVSVSPTSGDPVQDYEDVLEAAKPQWEALDKRYIKLSNLAGPGHDALEHAVLAYALGHVVAFETVVKAARASTK